MQSKDDLIEALKNGNAYIVQETFELDYTGIISNIHIRMRLDNKMDHNIDATRYHYNSFLKGHKKMKHEVTPKKQNKMDYSFIIPNENMINFREIAKDITLKNPLICVDTGHKKYIIVHDKIIKKAEILEIPIPESWQTVNYTETSEVFFITSNPKNEYSQKTSFKRSIIWIKKVIQAEWKPFNAKDKVSVFIPDLSV